MVLLGFLLNQNESVKLTTYEQVAGEGWVVSKKVDKKTVYFFIETKLRMPEKGTAKELYLKPTNTTKSYTRNYMKYPDLSFMLPNRPIGGLGGGGVASGMAARQAEYQRINELRKSLGEPVSEKLVLDVFSIMTPEETKNHKKEQTELYQPFVDALSEIEPFHIYKIENGRKKKAHKYKVKIVAIWHPNMPKPREIDDPQEWKETWADLKILLKDTKGMYITLSWSMSNSGGGRFSNGGGGSGGNIKTTHKSIEIAPYKTTLDSVSMAYIKVYNIYLKTGLEYDIETARMVLGEK